MIKKCLIAGLVVCSIALNQFALAGTWKDSFEDNDMSEWKIVDDWENAAGKWWVDKGEAVAESLGESSFAMWLTGESTWEYYTVSCRAKLVKSKKEPATFGIVMHANNNELLDGLLDEHYYFRVIGDFNFISIRKFRPFPAGPVTLGEFDFEVKTDRWYQLTAITRRNGKIEFYIDKKLFTVFDANPLEAGQTGVGVSNAEVRFDDVEITGQNIDDGGPGNTTLSVKPQAKLTTTWGHLKNN
ncbi:MAG: hypothetical protein OXH00_23205 [Candidatus Poribacteria bacterium]|nr:hypothetical protein [Candidatus Poribacteria bacterium]